MIFLKKFGLIMSAAVFSLSLLAATSYAQPGKAKWGGNKGLHKGWENGNWRNGRGQDRWRNRGISSREYDRLYRQRQRLNRTRNRYSNDGYISSKESQKLQKKYSKYRRNVYRARNNRN